MSLYAQQRFITRFRLQKSRLSITTRRLKATSSSKPTKKPEKGQASPEDSNFVNGPKNRGRDDDSLSRFPNLRTSGGILRGLDYLGSLTFAVSGSVTAAQSGLDVFGCSMVAMVTGVGGGTIRDAIFLSKRPFWTSETEYIWMTVCTGFLTFFAWPFVLEWKGERHLESEGKSKDSSTRDRTDEMAEKRITNGECDDKGGYYDELECVLDTFDAIGLSAFAIIGAQNGVRAGMPMAVSAICGMATSTFGGLMRDLLCGRPVRIVYSNAEVYAMPALAGAVAYLAGKRMRFSPAWSIGSGMVVCLGSRFMAVMNNIRLDTWENQLQDINQ